MPSAAPTTVRRSHELDACGGNRPRRGRSRSVLGLLDSARLVDRNLARKNIRTALIVSAVCFFMFGMTFVAAAIYIA